MSTETQKNAEKKLIDLNIEPEGLLTHEEKVLRLVKLRSKIELIKERVDLLLDRTIEKISGHIRSQTLSSAETAQICDSVCSSLAELVYPEEKVVEDNKSVDLKEIVSQVGSLIEAAE